MNPTTSPCNRSSRSGASGYWLNRLPRASIGWPGLFPVGPSRWAWCSLSWSSRTGALRQGPACPQMRFRGRACRPIRRPRNRMLAQGNMLLAAIETFAGIDVAMLLACLALSAATVVFIFLIEADPVDSAPHRSRLDQLLERRDTIYDNLRDLKFEHRAGKFSEQDYEETKNALETEAALVLAEIETVTGGQARPSRREISNAATRPAAAEKSPS